MKEGIHPAYEATVIRCACGNEIPTRSTKKDIRVEICSTTGAKKADAVALQEKLSADFTKILGF